MGVIYMSTLYLFIYRIYSNVGKGIDTSKNKVYNFITSRQAV
jgi:hypothetical protein